MNRMMWSVGSAMNLCARYTAALVSSSKVQGFTQLINSYQHLWIKCARSFTSRLRHAHVIHMLDSYDTLWARALSEGSTRARKGVARGVAGVLVGALCLVSTQTSEAQLIASKSLKDLANYQLDDKQYKCHNQIVYLESRWTIDAIGNTKGTKQTHGYYQLKSKAAQGKPYDYQFWMYWYYVAGRYGLSPDNPDLPNYCLALKHLKTRGWQ